MSEFSSVLKQLREREHLTQAELAKGLKISRSSIGMYETGVREPDFATLEKIAALFSVDMNYLLGKCGSGSLSSPLPKINNDAGSMLSVLLDSETIMLNGKPASPEAEQYLRQSFEAIIAHAKKLNENKE